MKIKRVAAALAGVALTGALLSGCGENDDCYEDEASSSGFELVAMTEGKPKPAKQNGKSVKVDLDDCDD